MGPLVHCVADLNLNMCPFNLNHMAFSCFFFFHLPPPWDCQDLHRAALELDSKISTNRVLYVWKFLEWILSVLIPYTHKNTYNIILGCNEQFTLYAYIKTSYHILWIYIILYNIYTIVIIFLKTLLDSAPDFWSRKPEVGTPSLLSNWLQRFNSENSSCIVLSLKLDSVDQLSFVNWSGMQS